MESVVRSPPDGYTLVMIALSERGQRDPVSRILTFIFLRDIAPVGPSAAIS